MFKIPEFKSLRILVMDCPIDNWDDPQVSALFHRLVSLKLRGYGKEYPYGAIAIDTTDFIGTHLIIAEDSPDGYLPLLAYKAITLERCETFRQKFTPLALASSSRAEGHEAALRELVRENTSLADRVVYSSSMTVQPEYREDRQFSDMLRQIFVSMHVNHTLSAKAQISMLCGVLRFKLDRLYESWGYRPLMRDGAVLPDIEQHSLFGEKVRMYSLSKFTDESLFLARRYEDLWESRAIIGEARRNSQNDKRKAA